MRSLEGDNSRGRSITERQSNRIDQPSKNKKMDPILSIGIFFIVVNVIIVGYSYYLMTRPEWQQYRMYDEGDEVVWENLNLQSQIRRFPSTDMYGNTRTVYVGRSRNIVDQIGRSPTGLLLEVLAHSDSLTEEQIKWFEYMCENVVE